jgi:hypothetical protein
MKHLTFANKNFLVGDAVADAIVEYAAALGERSSADTIDITAIGADGDEVAATLFLSTGVPLVAESSTAPFPEPNNTETEAYIEGRLALLSNPPQALPLDKSEEQLLDLDEWLRTQD